MQKTIIDKIYNDYLDLLNYLENNQEISLLNDARITNYHALRPDRS